MPTKKTNTITIRNHERDTKELGVVGGRKIVLGSTLDVDNPDLRVAKPEVTVSGEEYAILMESEAMRRAFDYWKSEHKISVQGA